MTNKEAKPSKLESICKWIEMSKTLVFCGIVIATGIYLVASGRLSEVANRKMEESLGVSVERFEPIQSPSNVMFMTMQEALRRETGVAPPLSEFSSLEMDESTSKVRWEPVGQPSRDYLFSRLADGTTESTRTR